MRCVAGGIAAACLAAGIGHGAERTAAPDAAWLYFSGINVWHSGAFVHGGLLWSPHGLAQEGFTLKLLAGTGAYRYRSGALGGVTVRGAQWLGSVMPGWRFKADRFEATVYAGLDLQDHRLRPDDPGAGLRGFYGGMRAGADLWYQPSDTTMLAANISVSTIGPTYWTRVATGWRVLDALWIGPEAQAMGGPDYQQWRVGIHFTALRTGAFEWCAGLGFAADSDDLSGVYARIGVLMRR